MQLRLYSVHKSNGNAIGPVGNVLYAFSFTLSLSIHLFVIFSHSSITYYDTIFSNYCNNDRSTCKIGRNFHRTTEYTINSATKLLFAFFSRSRCCCWFPPLGVLFYSFSIALSVISLSRATSHGIWLASIFVYIKSNIGQ